MIVLKFGGTSLGSGERIRWVAELVASRQPPGCLVVASAMAGVTDELLRLGDVAASGDAPAALEGLRALLSRHREALEEARIAHREATEVRKKIRQIQGDLAGLLRGVALLQELTPRSRDALMATGEILSSSLLAAALATASADAVWIDPRELVVTDGRFGQATPDRAEMERRVRGKVLPLLEAGRPVVTGGFVGRGPDGATTTLGRGGSDYTAALLGAALPAQAIEIWTDVDGILTADPRLVPGARPVPWISYREAAELAFFGAKVLHPATIEPAVERGIPVLIRNTLDPQTPGTVVRREAPGRGVRAIAARGGSTAVFISSPRMLLASGYAARVFGVFERHRVPVDVIATSEVSISTTVNAQAPVADVLDELNTLGQVEALPGLAVISVVGQGLRSTPGVAARTFAALGEINVVMISQGASDTNLTFVVAESEMPEAVRRVHRVFFEAAEAAA